MVGSELSVHEPRAVGDWEKLLKIEPANKNAIRELASTIELASKFRSSSRGKGDPPQNPPPHSRDTKSPFSARARFLG